MAEYRGSIELLTPVGEREYFRIFPARAARRAREVRRRRSRRRRRRSRATSCPSRRSRTSTTRSPASRCCATGGSARRTTRPPSSALVVGADGRRAPRARPALRDDPRGADPARGDARVRVLHGRDPRRDAATARDRSAAEFDAALGGRVCRLVDWKAAQRGDPSPRRCARCSACPRAPLSDDEAIALVLDPAKNPHPRRDAER